MRLVMKFGGTSIADGEKILHVADLLKKYHDEGHEVVAVTSALGGVTDALLETASAVAYNGKTLQVSELISYLREKHYTVANTAINDNEILDSILKELNDRIDELEKALIGICYLGELTLRSIDYISSYGERLAAPIVSGAVCSKGINSMNFTGGDIGIITDDVYGNAKPIENTYDRVYDKLNPTICSYIPIVTGFIAESEEGIITTLGRGGSDFTASIIAASINADEIWLWKEVAGIMTSDPKIVPEARTISQISYKEAMELSYFGAKVLHPRAIEPAIGRGIPVRVKNTFDPEFVGTIIVADEMQIEDVVKAVTLIDRVALVNISGAEMVGAIGTASRVFTALANACVNIIMISQGSSEANMSIVVDEAHHDVAVRVIKEEFGRDFVRVASDKDISVVAVVGAGMAGIPGVAGRVFNSLGCENINVIMISQGSSQHNISFVIHERDSIRTVRALHREFELDSEFERK